MNDFIMDGYQIAAEGMDVKNLVLYYDVTGKRNIDEYRDAVINLRNAKNIGELRNLNYTKQSGFPRRSSIVFDGIDDYLRFTLTRYIQDITLDLYISIDTTGNPQTIVQSGAHPYNWMLQENNKKLQFVKNRVVYETETIVKDMKDPGYLTLVMRGNIVKIYYKDELVLSETVGNKLSTSRGDIIYLGVSFPNSYYLKAEIFNVSLYDRSLQIGDLANNRRIDKERREKI